MGKHITTLEKVIDLNKKLTAENTKFVTDIDGWIAEKIKHENEANRLRVENERLLEELENKAFIVIKNNIPVLLNEIKVINKQKNKIELILYGVSSILLFITLIIYIYSMRNLT